MDLGCPDECEFFFADMRNPGMSAHLYNIATRIQFFSF